MIDIFLCSMDRIEKKVDTIERTIEENSVFLARKRERGSKSTYPLKRHSISTFTFTVG